MCVCQHVTLTLLKAHQTQLMMLPLSLNQLTELVYIIVQTPLVLYDNHWKSTGTATDQSAGKDSPLPRVYCEEKKLASQNCLYKTHKTKNHQFHHHRNEKEKSALSDHKKPNGKQEALSAHKNIRQGSSLSEQYVLLRELYSSTLLFVVQKK